MMFTSSKTKHPWDIYAQSLMYHGRGYPLWRPEPSMLGYEMEVGDVGFLHEGAFMPLLRTRRPTIEDQPYHVVPDGYEALEVEDRLVSKYSKSSVQCSKGCAWTQVAPSHSASATSEPSQTRLSFEFSTTRDGALLMVPGGGERTILMAQRRARAYVLVNAAKWTHLAKDRLGFEVKEEDLLFLTGTFKTSRRWVLAAWGGGPKGLQASSSYSFDYFDPPGETSFTVGDGDSPKESPGRFWFRSGACRPEKSCHSESTTTTAALSSTKAETDSDCIARDTSSIITADTLVATEARPRRAAQCVFFNYYRTKRRFGVPARFLKDIKAGAGPHELPRHPDDTDASPGVPATDDSGMCTEDEDLQEGQGYASRRSPKKYEYDPVKDLLDYILGHSDAEIAIASDLDLYALFEQLDESPEDVASALEQLKPAIEVDGGTGGNALTLPSSSCSPTSV
ncbi:hypothetical protein BV20DRAFT_357286 [Pilatotrama ljubarskyi]|nr:hypothetical protein BV20DRAFT_357286 [Pilatotrama ljubarskyi]